MGYAPEWGAFGLTASAGFAAGIEFLLLERWLSKRIGKVAIPTKLGITALVVSFVAAAAAFGAYRLAIELHLRTWMASVAAIGIFGVIYLAGMAIARVPEASAFVRRALRRR
jgi:putative peptidoglycan lipid II flippase